jgi:predicted MFS family arabinose efflux permease
MFNRREKTILCLMAMVHFCLIVDFMIVMPQGPQLMRELGISARQFSLMVSVYTLGAGFLSLVGALFIDRFERGRALIFSLVGFAAANFACAVAGDFGALIIARGLTGAFAGVVGAVLFAIVSDSIDVARRASALGLVMSSFAVASILGVPACLFLASRLGWHAPFVALGVFSLLGCAIIGVALGPINRHLESGQPRTSPWSELGEVVTSPGRSLALLFMGCLILGHFSINPFLFPSVIANSGITEDRLPAVYLIAGIASMAASVAFGKASDFFGKKLVFSGALVASLAPIYWVTHLKPMGILPVILVVASFFILMGGRLTPAMAMVTSTAEPRNRGSFLSLVGSVQQLAAAVAATVAGFFVTRADDGRLLGFGRVGAFAILFSLLALFLSRRLVSTEAPGGGAA